MCFIWHLFEESDLKLNDCFRTSCLSPFVCRNIHLTDNSLTYRILNGNNKACNGLDILTEVCFTNVNNVQRMVDWGRTIKRRVFVNQEDMPLQKPNFKL